jgi:hypothetical protein
MAAVHSLLLNHVVISYCIAASSALQWVGMDWSLHASSACAVISHSTELPLPDLYKDFLIPTETYIEDGNCIVYQNITKLSTVRMACLWKLKLYVYL